MRAVAAVETGEGRLCSVILLTGLRTRLLVTRDNHGRNCLQLSTNSGPQDCSKTLHSPENRNVGGSTRWMFDHQLAYRRWGRGEAESAPPPPHGPQAPNCQEAQD
jgi:hypothetical protein